jgi:lipopolysaccharide biosynthesis protein
MTENEKLYNTIKALEVCSDIRERSHFLVLSKKIMKRIYPFIVPFISPIKKLLGLIKSSPQLESVPKVVQKHDDSRITTKTTIAVVVHLYYFELADEVISYLKNIDHPFSLYINTPVEKPQKVKEKFIDIAKDLYIDQFENKGRDILPFLETTKKYSLHKYDVICKIHTKKSLHSEIGNYWRFALFNSMLGSVNRVNCIVNSLVNNSRYGLASCKELIIYTNIDHMNRKNLQFLNRFYKIKNKPAPYVAGTMFWIKGSTISPIFEKDLSKKDFHTEAGKVDGNLEHAYERFFGSLLASQDQSIIGFPVNIID